MSRIAKVVKPIWREQVTIPSRNLFVGTLEIFRHVGLAGQSMTPWRDMRQTRPTKTGRIVSQARFETVA